MKIPAKMCWVMAAQKKKKQRAKFHQINEINFCKNHSQPDFNYQTMESVSSSAVGWHGWILWLCTIGSGFNPRLNGRKSKAVQIYFIYIYLLSSFTSFIMSEQHFELFISKQRQYKFIHTEVNGWYVLWKLFRSLMYLHFNIGYHESSSWHCFFTFFVFVFLTLCTCVP